MTWNNETRDIKDGKKESLFSELHSLLSSGLDFGRSFRLLIEGENDKRLKRVLESIYASVVKGQTLWESFAAGERFTALDYGVLRIGEETGRVDESLRFLADYYHKRVEQRRLVTGAISYPLIILVTAIVVLVFMITVIVPMFERTGVCPYGWGTSGYHPLDYRFLEEFPDLFVDRDIHRYRSGGILLVEREIGFYSLFSVSSGFEDSSCGRVDTEKLSGTFL